MARVYLVYLDVSTGMYPGLHHGLASLIGAIRHNGHTVLLHHVVEEEPAEQFCEKVMKFKPDVVGFSLTSNQRRYLEKYSNALYAKSKVIQVAGGLHPTLAPDDTFKLEGIKGICFGEAEYIFPDLLERIDKKKQVFDTPGFWWRKDDGTIQRNMGSALEKDLSKLPYPDYSDFNVKEINQHHGGLMSMLLTRGCPYSCTYCGNTALQKVYSKVYTDTKSIVRLPPVDWAIGLIKHNLELYPDAKGIFFVDELLIRDTQWFHEFCEKYSKEVSVPFACTARVELINENTCAGLQKAGCILVQVGVECGNEWYREKMLNRKMSNADIIRAFKLLRQYGVQSFSFSMVGMPFETKELMEETLELNKKIKPDFGQVSYFFAYPGTKLYDTCKEYGLITEKQDQLSGYMEGPSIKLTHCTEKDCTRIYNKIKLYLMARLVGKHMGAASDLTTNFVYLISTMAPKFFVDTLTLTKRSKFQYKLREMGYKYIFFNNSARNGKAESAKNTKKKLIKSIVGY